MLLTALLALGGCGGKAPPPAMPAAAASVAEVPSAASVQPPTAAPIAATSVVPTPAASIAAPATAIEVVRLTLGTAVDTALEVTAAGTRFAPTDKTLYAAVATRGRTAEATLNARWRYLEGHGQLISSISQTIAADGPATTTFTLQNPDLWPEGKYEVEISVDGVAVTQRNFEIARP